MLLYSSNFNTIAFCMNKILRKNKLIFFSDKMNRNRNLFRFQQRNVFLLSCVCIQGLNTVKQTRRICIVIKLAYRKGSERTGYRVRICDPDSLLLAKGFPVVYYLVYQPQVV